MADREKKEGKKRIQKFEYLKNKKVYHLVKNKNLIKIADTSFKQTCSSLLAVGLGKYVLCVSFLLLRVKE